MKKKNKLKWYVYPMLFIISLFLLPITFSKFTSSFNNDINLSITKPSYTIRFDANGGTGTMDDINNCKYGISKTLSHNTFVNSDKTFLGWNTEQDGTGKYYKDNDEVKYLSGTNGGIITLYAQWLDSDYLNNSTKLKDYTCTESVETFTAPSDGYYLLEAWGAQGGSVPENTNGSQTLEAIEGGKGGYSYGIVYLNKNDEIYVAVGCEGKTLINSDKGTTLEGGYNGGGQALSDSPKNYQGSGGGATHFAIENNLGVLENYATNQNDILLVAGGGGGSYNSTSINYYSIGGSGGGQLGGSAFVYYKYKTSPVTNNGYTYYYGLEIPGASQLPQSNTNMYIFGTFGKGTDAEAKITGSDAGAGGGWYGGARLNFKYGGGGMAGGGGSGHINTTRLTVGKTLAGNIDIPTHDGTDFMNGNIGDGYAKISSITPHYKVKFNSNGGTGSMNDMDFVVGTSKKLAANTFTRSEYEFIGWNTKANGQGTNYDNEATVNNLSTIYGDEVTLYAQWRNRIIYFQLPPDWYGTNVCAKLYTSAQNDDPTCTDADAMTLLDSDKKIYKFDTSSYSNIDDYSIVYFSNGITIEDSAGKTPRRAIAQNFKDESGKAKLEKIFVPELYNERGKTRVYGYATNFYFYFWKDSTNNGWPGDIGEVIGQRIHKITFNTADYENMIVNQGKSSNQSADLTVPQYQDITYKLTSNNLYDKTYEHLAYRLFYEGSWHDYDDWIDSEYDSWYESDYVSFQTAKNNLGY